AGAPAGRGETAILVEARQPLPRSRLKGPLLRPEAVEQGVAEPRIIEVATGGEGSELVEQRRSRVEGEQTRLPRTQPLLQTAGHLADDGPVRARLAGWRHGAAH